MRKTSGASSSKPLSPQWLSKVLLPKKSILAQGSTNCSVSIQTTDLCGNTIVTALAGPAASGTFTLSAIRSNSTTTQIFSATRQPGTYTDPFNISGLANGVDYTGIRASWVCGGTTITTDMAYAFKILGTYRHSQYNTPNEADATCQTGGTVNVCFTNNNCVYTTGTLPGTFASQTALNGSGQSLNHGLIQPEAFCQTHGFPPPTACQGIDIFRANQVRTPQCTGLGLSDTTVARNPNHPDLGCGDNVCLVGTPGGNILKTVTDRCPRCSNTQLDNFTTTDGRCTGIGDLGNFLTVKVP
jgi:hypothetical protein